MPESEQDIETIFLESEERMQKAIDAFQRDMNAVRSTRATPSMLDTVHVEYYGSNVPLNQLASVTVPEPRMLLITPYDKSSMGDIEKSILKSDLNLSPQNDGTVIRLILPELSMERRQELVKQVKHRLEEARVSIRNIRRDTIDHLKKLTGKGHSEDEIKTSQEEVQNVTNQYIQKAEELAEQKEKSILTV
ncbi:MAG: ribosome recycling factor [Spirochaetia bacterium]|nr:ribosome recycling factor [Spirochaetia bacterium]